MMDTNYNDPPLLTNSDYESLMEDLKPEGFSDFGSPFRMEQNVTYEDPNINPMMRPLVQSPLTMQPLPPPLQVYGPVPVQNPLEGHEEPVHTTTTPPKLSPSLSPTGTIPSRDTYPGVLEFEIQLSSATSSKRSWLFSHLLNKVFIDMNKSLLIQFRVSQFMNGLFVRALPVFEQDDFVSIPVERCSLHCINDDPHGKAHPKTEPGVCYCHRRNNVRHVVLCSHPLARYDYDSVSDRHSVVVPLQEPHPGSDTTTVEYLFTCKTSCPRGMNRKPITVIYTLENSQCEVLGRSIMPVKICSCPKRDKEKEEKEKEERDKELQEAINNGFPQPKHGKRRLSSHDKEEAKRVKSETTQNETVQETSISVIATKLESLETIIKETRNQMDQKPNQLESKIDQKLNQLESKIDQKLNQLESKIDQKLNQLESKIELESKIDQRLNQLESKIDQKLNQLESKIDQKLNQLITKIDHNSISSNVNF